MPFDDRSHAQKVAVATVPRITGSISFVSSAVMLYMILQSDIKLGTPFRRLIFAMCIVDLLQSGVSMLSTLPSPIDTPGIWGAYGNTTSCTITGVIFQYSSSAMPLYMCSLCVHYLCFVRRKVTQKTFIEKIEPLLHIIPNAWCFSVAAFLAAKKCINQADTVCWIAPLPYDCIHNPDVDCIRGEKSFVYRWIFGAGPNAASLLVICCLMFKIYLVDKEQDDQSSNQEGEQKGRNTDLSSRFEDGDNQIAPVSGNHNDKERRKSGEKKGESKAKLQQVPVGTIRRSGIKSDVQFRTDISMVSSNISKNVEEMINVKNPSGNSLPKCDMDVVHDTHEMRYQRHLHANFGYRQREAKKQAFLFVGSFCIVYCFIYFNGALEQFNIESPFIARLSLWTIFPLQGFFNIIIFTRPHVVALMQKEEGLLWRAAVWKVIQSGGDVSRKLRPIRTQLKRRSSLYWKAQHKQAAEDQKQHAQYAEDQPQDLPAPSTNTKNSLRNDRQHIYPKGPSTIHSRPMSHVRSNFGGNLSSLGIESFDDDSGMSSTKLYDDGAMYGDNDYDIYDDDRISLDGESHVSDIDGISYDVSHKGRNKGANELLSRFGKPNAV